MPFILFDVPQVAFVTLTAGVLACHLNVYSVSSTTTCVTPHFDTVSLAARQEIDGINGPPR